MSNKRREKRFRIEKIAPEGDFGFGYLIPIGIATSGACSIGSLASFGLLFNDFLTDLGAKTSAVTMITGTYFCALSFGALSASALFKKFPMRAIGIFGAIIFFVGSFLTAFATSVEHLVITFGVFEGAGFGFMIPTAYTTFNAYFVKKRMFVMSLCQASKGIGIMAYPIMVQYLMDKYGFRGAAAVISAIHAHNIFAMICMHPVEWHCEIIKIPIEESTSLIESNEKKLKIDRSSEEKYELRPISSMENGLTIKSILTKSDLEIYQKNERNSNSKLIANGQSNSHDALPRLVLSHKTQERRSSTLYLNGVNGTMHEFKEIKKGLWQKFVDFFDLTLLKDWVFVNLLFGQCFVMYSDSAFSTLLPMYLLESGFSKNDTASLVSISSAADMCSRILLVFMSLCVHMKARNFTLIGAIATIIFRLVFLKVHDFMAMMVIVFILGFFRTWLHVTLTLSFAEYLPQNRFPAGYGLFLFCKGNFIFLVSPIVGFIRDSTKSYVICFNTITFILALCAVPWIFEIIWFRMQSQKSNKPVQINKPSSC